MFQDRGRLLFLIFTSLTSSVRLHRYFRTILFGGLLLLADTYVSVLVARRIGIYAMLAAHTGVSLFSFVTLRSSILSQFNQLKREMRFGVPKYARFVHIVLYSFGALMLVIPGFVSSIIGFLIFVPPIRQISLHILKSYAHNTIQHTYNQLRVTLQSPDIEGMNNELP